MRAAFPADHNSTSHFCAQIIYAGEAYRVKPENSVQITEQEKSCLRATSWRLPTCLFATSQLPLHRGVTAVFFTFTQCLLRPA